MRPITMMIKKEVQTTLTTPYLQALNNLVEKGIYLAPQVAIREALRRLFQFYGIEPFTDKGIKSKKVARA